MKLTALLCALPLLAFAALPPQCEKMHVTYIQEMKKLADSYNAGLQPMAEDYVLGLRRLSDKFKGAKDEESAAAAKAEAARFVKALAEEPDPFESVPELTAEAIVKKPQALRLAQEDYADKRKGREFKRNQGILDLTQKYCAALEKWAAANSDDPAVKKEATRIRVILQDKGFALRLLRETGNACLSQPAKLDLANLKEKAQEPAVATKNLDALILGELPPSIQMFLMKPMEYDKSWPPEVTKWKFMGTGNYAHDFTIFNEPGQPAQLGIFAYAQTMRAYIRGTINSDAQPFAGNKALAWRGKAMAWRLADSRDLVCRVVFRTRKPAVGENSGPAACVAVYSIDEKNKPLASLTAPMVGEETTLFMAKHYSYNRLNIKWEGTKRKRGFTIPDHMPLLVIAGVVGHAKGEEIDATVEILPSGQLED
jgi:hypothetical protein